MTERTLCSFPQVSDKVPAHVVKAVTVDCKNPVCVISARIEGTTLMGTSSHYDRDGILRVNDENRFTAKLCCRTCWTGWRVNQDGKILETETTPGASERRGTTT